MGDISTLMSERACERGGGEGERAWPCFTSERM